MITGRDLPTFCHWVWPKGFPFFMNGVHITHLSRLIQEFHVYACRVISLPENSCRLQNFPNMQPTLK